MLSNETSTKAKQKLQDFCAEIKSTFNGIIDKFQQNVEKHFENICVDVTLLSPILQQFEEKLADCQNDSEMFIPMDKLANFHNDVVSLDKKMVKLKNEFQIPKNIDVELIETTVQKLLKNLGGPSLSKNVFGNVTEDCQLAKPEKYIPTLFQQLRLAIIKNDIEMFKSIVENPEMPPRSINYILQYGFEINASFDPPKHSALIFAGINNSFDIIRYLIHLDGIDLLQRSGRYNIVQYLLSNKRACSVVDKLVEEILAIQPKLVNEIDSEDLNLLQFVIFHGSTYLCRLLVEKYNFNVNAHFRDGSTPLTHAIFCKNMKSYKQLLSLGASPAVTEKDKNSTLHIACQEEWPEGICELVSKFPDMLNWNNDDGDTPLSLVITEDDLGTMKTIYDCLKQHSIEMEFLNKNYLVKLANCNKASKILEWAKLLNSDSI